MKSKRILVSGAALAVALAGGGAALAGPKVKTEVAPNLEKYTIQKVAVLGFANTTGAKEADQMGTLMVQALIATEKCYFAPADRFELDAKRTGLAAEHGRMLSTWLKKRTVDEEVLAKVLAATGYDAVLAVEINDWRQSKLTATEEGTSDTMVGVMVRLYAPDGTLLWGASERRTERSQPYNPNFNLRATESGETRATSAGAIPNPPPYPEVAASVAQNVASTLPDFKKPAKPAEEGGKKGEAPGE